MPMPETVNGLPLKPGAWEAHEDDLLAKYQLKLGNRWAAVAKHIPGRTGQQCAQRWRHRVNPNITKEKWTTDEDGQLFALVQRHGNFWAEIARGLKGRTDQQCMGRWRRHLDPSIKRDSWKAGEDAKLAALYAQYASQWARICKHIRGRTAQQCRARWYQLAPEEPLAAGGPSLESQPAVRRARRTTRRRARRFSSDSNPSEVEERVYGGDEDQDDNSNSSEEQSYVAAPVTAASMRSRRHCSSHPDETTSLTPPLGHQETAPLPLLWKAPPVRGGEQAEDDDPDLEGEDGFDTPVKSLDPPRMMASSRSAMTSCTYMQRKRRSSIVTLASVNDVLPSAADTPGQSSLSALTGVSPGGPGRRGAGLQVQHPPLFLSPDSVLAHPRLATHPRLAAHRLPAPEILRPVLDCSGGGNPAEQEARLTPHTAEAVAALRVTPAQESLPTGAAEQLEGVPAAVAGSQTAADNPAVAAVELEAADTVYTLGTKDWRPAEPRSYSIGVSPPREPDPASEPETGAGPEARSCVAPELVESPARRTPVKQKSPTRQAASPSFDTFLMSPTERRTAETLFATPQRLGTTCGARRRNPLASPPGLAGRVARQALEARLRAAGPSATTTPRRQDGGGGGGFSSPGALLAMLSSPEQPDDALLAPNSEFRIACQLLVTPEWVRGRGTGRSGLGGGPPQRASQKGGLTTLSRAEEQELRASRLMATARSSRPSVARRLLIDPEADEVLVESRPGADQSAKKQRYNGLPVKLELGAGPQSNQAELGSSPVAAEAPATAVSGLTSKALEPLLAPWQDLDMRLAPFATNMSTFDSAMAAFSKLNGYGGPIAKPVPGHTPKPCAEDAAASSSHVRMRLHALLDNL